MAERVKRPRPYDLPLRRPAGGGNAGVDPRAAALIERVVLGRREGGVAGFHWSGKEPKDLNSVALAEELGAVWEGRELVHYDMASLDGRWST